jgi:hypothetical protein
MISLRSIAAALRFSLAMQVKRRTEEEKRAALKLAQRLAADARREAEQDEQTKKRRNEGKIAAIKRAMQSAIDDAWAAELDRRLAVLDGFDSERRREKAARVEQIQLDELAAQIARRQRKTA